MNPHIIIRIFLLSLYLLSVSPAHAETPPAATSLWGLKATTIDNKEIPLAQFGGNVALVVNTASKCGFTPQYAQLEQLYQTYKGRGFVVLAFPSNDFGEQEPGSNEEVKRFSTEEFKVTFPLFTKAPVSGESKQPVYRFLTEDSGYSGVLWNFEKFLIGRDGRVIDRFRSLTEPTSSNIVAAIEKAL